MLALRRLALGRRLHIADEGHQAATTTPPPPAERDAPLPDRWRYATYLSHCISAVTVIFVVALASAAALKHVYKSSSDTTSVFDSGGATARDANSWALGPVPLLLPLVALCAAIALVLTSVSSWVCRLTSRLSALSRTNCYVLRGCRAPGGFPREVSRGVHPP